MNRAVVVQTFNPSIWEAKADGSLSSTLARSIEQVPGQPALHRETLLQKSKTKDNDGDDNDNEDDDDDKIPNVASLLYITGFSTT